MSMQTVVSDLIKRVEKFNKLEESVGM